jgi:hypothetical protein
VILLTANDGDTIYPVRSYSVKEYLPSISVVKSGLQIRDN